jgi:hypothetical protein
VQAGQVGVGFAPVDLWEAEVEVGQGHAHRDVGQREMDAGAPGLFAQAQAHGLQGRVDLGQVAVDPGGAALGVGAARPGLLQARGDRGIQQAIGQRLPGAHLRALAAGGRDQPAHRGEGVDVFHDHARIEHRLATFHHQAGHLAQRVGRRDARVGRPDVFQFQAIVELLFGHHDAHLAHVGAGERSDQFHGEIPGQTNCKRF